MKNGFTLAEVLITLGIIGVVAAITLPALVANHQKQVLKTGLKKAYSRLNEAAARYHADNGEPLQPEDFNNNPAKINEFIQTYYNAPVYCGVKGSFTAGNGCSNADNGFVNNHKCYNDIMGLFVARYGRDGQWVLPDGSFLMAYYNDSVGAIWTPGITLGSKVAFWMSVDVNGAKPPNRWGKDTFVFQLMPSGRFLPLGVVGTTWEEMGKNNVLITDEAEADGNFCNINSTSALNGITCTDNALYDENFWKQMKL